MGFPINGVGSTVSAVGLPADVIGSTLNVVGSPVVGIGPKYKTSKAMNSQCLKENRSGLRV